MSTLPRREGQSTEPVRAPRPDIGLGRAQRITRSAVFREAYAQGRRQVGRCMVMWLRTGPGASLRVGVVSSRKVGNAVERNRARRLLREVFRRHRFQFAGDVDIVLVARRALLDARWAAIEREFDDLARRAGLLPEAGADHAKN